MKKKVAVVFGSMSSEYGISCISASNVIENIDISKYKVVPIGIDKNGNFFRYFGKLENIRNTNWVNDKENKKKIDNIISCFKKFDVIIPVLHGKYGEDGAIQGILEFAKVKYVGCKILGSSIAMNKKISKDIVSSNNIPVVDYIFLNKYNLKEMKNNIQVLEDLKVRINNEINYPLIVKPNREGSSYGVQKVDKEEDLLAALEKAFEFDDEILIEKYISNRKEIECAAITLGPRIFISTPGEICSANSELYDFEAKYENKESYTKIPASISLESMTKIKEYAEKIFKILHLNQISRIDFFISDGQIYFNEVNTMPGFTNISMYPKMLEYEGYSYKDILSILIDNAS